MAKDTKRKPADVEVLPAMTEEIALATEAGLSIKSFLAGVAAFFGKAAQLEAAAERGLKAAELLKPPTNGREDEAIQSFIVERKDAAKVGEAHWETITSTLHGWHKRATARRARITGVELKAAEIGQKLHNGYVDAENKRVAREAEEARQEAERDAQRKRDKELEDLEKKALAAEAKSPDLSEREAKFVEGFVNGYVNGFGQLRGDATRSARAAGYNDAAATGKKLTDTPKIQKAIKAAHEARAAREQAAAIAEAPLEVEVRDVKPADVTKAIDAQDRDTHTGIVVDEGAIVEAFRSGKYGIPGDLFQVNPAKLNEYARSLRVNLNRWPGVQYKKTTRTI